MSLEEHVVFRDHFDLENDGSGFAFPCCMCRHRWGSDKDEPCRTCDHNACAAPGEGQ